MKGFKNVNAYIYGEGIKRVDIAIKNGKIFKIGKDLAIDEVICADNGLVCPGFIDRHIHGANGADAMNADVSSIATIAKSLVKEGTTSFLVTTMTSELNQLKKVISSVKNYQRHGGAMVEGIHLEGPFISKKYFGAQPQQYILPPSVEVMKSLLSSDIKLVTIAVEEEGATELIKFLKENNVAVSVGHSNATYNCVLNAVKHGLSSVTHTFNAQSPFNHREVGVVGSAMLLDELYTEIICDFIHVDKQAVKCLIKQKPTDKIVLITDSMMAKGLGDGEGYLGGQKVYIQNGEARLQNGTLAGSVLKMNEAIKNLVTSKLASMENAIDFATANPAKSLGIFDRVGSISVGKEANFTVLDEEYNVLKTIVQGETEYEV